MSAVYDNWERLVRATLDREHYRYLCRIDSASSSDSAASSSRRSWPITEASLDFQRLGHSFTYQQILHATGSFSNKNLIKRGSSGDLFRGDIRNSGVIFSRRNLVVVKRVDLKLVSDREAYLWELDFLSKVFQVRFFLLLGHCLVKKDEKFLVYKYMSNGDLSSSLFRKDPAKDDLISLDWITRLKIATGAAQGLAYLHEECTPPLVHGDVQASSILLGDHFEVKLCSLSQSGAQENDAHSFDNWISRTWDHSASGTPNATCVYDVYCFGKVLLELVTGKLGISSSTDATMKEWLETTLPYISIYDKELVTNIVDPSLIIDEDFLEEVWSMAIIARSCLNPNPTKRPLMRYIFKGLENPLKVVREEHTTSTL